MNALQFPLAGIDERGIDIDATLPLDSLQPAGASDLPMESVRVRGLLELIDTELVFRGSLHADYRHACDRCLEILPFTLEVETIWAGSAGEMEAADDAEAWDAGESGSPEIVVKDGLADLGPAVWEELVLNVPMKHVYPADSAGKCPACKRDVNGALASSGSEEAPAAESKFAQLADLYRELQNGNKEE